MLLLALLACTAPPEADTAGGDAPTCDDPAEAWVGVATWMYFARRADDGTTVGFDLDGVVSDGDGPQDCGKADLVSPAGTPGIDSAFSGMLPALEATEASAVEGLIQDSIANGELLVLVELTGLDDRMDDDCVTGAVYRGDGQPLLGTDGALLDSQTFDLADGQQVQPMTGLSVVDGAVDMGPFALDLPLQVLDVELDFHVRDARMHLQLAEDGTFQGYYAGVVPVEDILLIAAEEDLGATGELIESLVTLAADIDATEPGACDGLSIVFELRGAPAFIRR